MHGSHWLPARFPVILFAQPLFFWIRLKAPHSCGALLFP